MAATRYQQKTAKPHTSHLPPAPDQSLVESCRGHAGQPCFAAGGYCHGWRCFGQRFTTRNLPPLTGAVHSLWRHDAPTTSAPAPPPPANARGAHTWQKCWSRCFLSWVEVPQPNRHVAGTCTPDRSHPQHAAPETLPPTQGTGTCPVPCAGQVPVPCVGGRVVVLPACGCCHGWKCLHHLPGHIHPHPLQELPMALQQHPPPLPFAASGTPDRNRLQHITARSCKRGSLPGWSF
jgi:hypothetical protein